jgi:hypothetical protein
MRHPAEALGKFQALGADAGGKIAFFPAPCPYSEEKGRSYSLIRLDSWMVFIRLKLSSTWRIRVWSAKVRVVLARKNQLGTISLVYCWYTYTC